MLREADPCDRWAMVVVGDVDVVDRCVGWKRRSQLRLNVLEIFFNPVKS